MRSHTALLIIIASIWIVCAVGVHYSNAITVKTNSQEMRGYFNEPHIFVSARKNIIISISNSLSFLLLFHSKLSEIECVYMKNRN